MSIEELAKHIAEYKVLYVSILTVLSFAALWWLGRYFATKSDVKNLCEKISSSSKELEQHKTIFYEHQREHFLLRETVSKIDSHISSLPTASEMSNTREQLNKLIGRLEGMEPVFKQILNNQNILIENELKGSSNGD